MNPAGTDIVNKVIESFPIPQTNYQHLYLNAADMSLNENLPPEISSVSYNAAENGAVQFRIKFNRDIQLCGYFKAHLYVSTNAGNDMDLFMYVQREDSLGVMRYPKMLHVDYQGAEARLRVSHREVTNNVNWDYCYDTTNATPIQAGEIVEVEPIFWPMGMIWKRGETLVLTISSANKRVLEFQNAPPVKTINKGIHSIYTGGKYASWLEIPLIDK